MAPGGGLAMVLGPIFGVGAGRGVGVIISLVGLLIIMAEIIALNIPQLTRVEVDLPDYDLAQATRATQPAE